MSYTRMQVDSLKRGRTKWHIHTVCALFSDSLGDVNSTDFFRRRAKYPFIAIAARRSRHNGVIVVREQEHPESESIV